MQVITHTRSLIIREFVPGEEELYLNHFNDEEVCLHIPKRSRDERTSIFRRALAAYNDSKQTGIWGMFNNVSGEFTGSCLLRFYNNEPDELELGYSIEKKYWNKGIGTEMAIAMVAYSFEDKKIKEIVALTTLENVASQKVLQKAGLQRLDDINRDGEQLAFFKIENPATS